MTKFICKFHLFFTIEIQILITTQNTTKKQRRRQTEHTGGLSGITMHKIRINERIALSGKVLPLCFLFCRFLLRRLFGGNRLGECLFQPDACLLRRDILEIRAAYNTEQMPRLHRLTAVRTDHPAHLISFVFRAKASFGTDFSLAHDRMKVKRGG